MPEWGDFLLAESSASGDRAVGSGVQHEEAALGAGLQAAGAVGVRAANGGSPVAFGSLRSAIRKPCSVGGCAINSLTRRGTKTLSGQVFHGETGNRALKELARSYLALTRDTTRVMNRLKALYRSWAIPCAGQRVYAPHYRSEWLVKISEAGVHRRTEIYYQQFDALRSLREQVRRDLLAEGRKHCAMNLLRQIPSIGPIRAVLLIALMQTPHRFRTKRQLWAYCGLALKTSTSGEYRIVEGQLKRSKKFLAIRGLNANHNHDLKNIFKGAATRAAAVPGPFQEFHAGLVARGMKPTMARLTLARKIAAITLIVWKKGVRFDAEYLKQQAA